MRFRTIFRKRSKTDVHHRDSGRLVGGKQNINIDIRIIAATNNNLKEAIAENNFREDLYYRLSVFEIQLPPLRERKEDIPLLADFFLKLYAQKMGKAAAQFSQQALEILVHHDWYSNVRELANVIEKAVNLAKDTEIQAEHLPLNIRGQADIESFPSESFEEAINYFKKQLIVKALSKSDNNKAEAARQLKISPSYLFRLVNQFGLQLK
ncbi:sigma-54-dependent Fis family transcriptional regulator [candidate division KSB1 bacterium]|nr:sigma-54-dependent Fis family transcriptional regulator [candidate division KSB1 bacterium]